MANSFSAQAAENLCEHLTSLTRVDYSPPPNRIGKTPSAKIKSLRCNFRAASIAYPFDEKNTFPAEFLERLQEAISRKKPLAKTEDRLRIAFLCAAYPSDMALALRLMELLAERGCECCLCDQNSLRLIPLISPSLTFSITALPEFDPTKCVPSVRFWSNFISKPKAAGRHRNFIYGTSNIDELTNLLQRSGRKVRSQQILLSVRRTDFCDRPKRRLFYSAVGWDKRRGTNYRPLYHLLDRTGYFETYGTTSIFRDVAPHSYRGTVTDPKDFLERMRAAGVALVLHGDDHLRFGTSSSRVFEGAAASCVLICDRHPFITKNFGDSVLYVDHTLSPTEMFRQIDGHMRWILNHPEEAIELARRSHTIFAKKFPLENEVEKIERFFREVVAEDGAARQKPFRLVGSRKKR
ncbi:MAG: glycosyltransferase [Puniceicoccales bacterium]|jgi:hypothetical protein|nr:glycosyltransferase [Puniceicoccales bacterium]